MHKMHHDSGRVRQAYAVVSTISLIDSMFCCALKTLRKDALAMHKINVTYPKHVYWITPCVSTTLPRGRTTAALPGGKAASRRPLWADFPLTLVVERKS